MGDYNANGLTTSLLKPNGTVESGFSLRWKLRFAANVFASNIKTSIFSRGACAIPDPDTDTVIVTGGRFSYVIVSIYNEEGWVRNLKGLNKKRRFHGCTSFVTGGEKVNTVPLMRCFELFQLFIQEIIGGRWLWWI